jgi:hypothetical protein
VEGDEREELDLSGRRGGRDGWREVVLDDGWMPYESRFMMLDE